MSKWLSDANLDLILDAIANSDKQVVCSLQPTTYYNAIWPDLWIQETTYVVGDLVHPPTTNNFIYECTVGGDSGATEPGWTTAQDSTFSDGTVTWKAHTNCSLASYDVPPGSLVKSDGATDGRTLTVPQVMGVVTHEAGTVSHTALLETATKTLHIVTTAETTLSGDNDVVAGRTTLYFEFLIDLRDPI